MALSLKAAITATQTTIDVLGTDALSEGDLRLIGTEQIEIRAGFVATLAYGEAAYQRLTVYRGRQGTTKAAHAVNAALTVPSAGEGGGGVTVDNTVDTPFAATSLVAPGATDAGSGVINLLPAVIAEVDPGAIGAGNLWLRLDGAGTVQELLVRDDADTAWLVVQLSHSEVVTPGVGETAVQFSTVDGVVASMTLTVNSVVLNLKPDGSTVAAAVYLDDGGTATLQGEVGIELFAGATILGRAETGDVTLETAEGTVMLRSDPDSQLLGPHTLALAPSGVLSLNGVPIGTQAAFVANGSTVDQLRDALIASGLMAAS